MCDKRLLINKVNKTDLIIISLLMIMRLFSKRIIIFICKLEDKLNEEL